MSATEAKAQLQAMQFDLQLLQMRLDSQDVKPASITGVLMELESLRTQFFQIVGSLAEHKDPLSKEDVFAMIKRISDARDRARILAPLPSSIPDASTRRLMVAPNFQILTFQFLVVILMNGDGGHRTSFCQWIVGPILVQRRS